MLLTQSRQLMPLHIGLAVLAGCAHATSLAWPFSFQFSLLLQLGLRQGQPVWWLQLLALGLLAWLLECSRNADCRNCRRGNWRFGAFLGWLFATVWLTATFGWLFVAMHTYAGLPFVLAAMAVLALAGLLACYYALVFGVFVAIAPISNSWSTIVFAALWLLAELARGTWMTGFGWGAAGYAHVDGPLAGYAPWLGVYGVSALSAWLAMTLAHLVQRKEPTQADQLGLTRSWRGQIGGLTTVLLVLALPAVFRMEWSNWTLSSGRLGVTLLQGNIPQDEKFEAGTGVRLALQWYAEQMHLSHSALVIAPETAIPVLPQQLPADYWAALQQRFTTGEQAALMGMPLGNNQEGYTNSVLGLKAGQAQPWRYDKHHLVPFGEFIPPLFKWFTALMNIPLGDFNRGALKQPSFEWQGQRLAPTICYENLFGEELAPHFLDLVQAPTIFINISNLAWFGQSLALDQHLQIARMRSLEFERPFVLATNTGATAIVDYQGRIVSSMPRTTRAVLVGEVEGRTGVTPYAWWAARFGLWPFWLLALGLALQATRASLRKRL